MYVKYGFLSPIFIIIYKINYILANTTTTATTIKTTRQTTTTTSTTSVSNIFIILLKNIYTI